MQISCGFVMTPIYPYSSYGFLKHYKTPINLYFLNSGRSSLELIIQDLQQKYDSLTFLIPAYICMSVVFALTSQEAEFDFVDLDETLNFDVRDLNVLNEKYQDRQVVLISTALFGCTVRNYKKSHPSTIIIEDRAQGLISVDSEADYQFTSFGKGKLVSAWNGGAVYTREESFKELYEKQQIAHGFLYSYVMANAQKFITKYLYFLIEKTPLNPEQDAEPVFKENYIYKLSPTKINWILHSLKTQDLSQRFDNSKVYLKKIDENSLFNLQGEFFLRLPVKKKIDFSGASFIYDYRYTYEMAKKKRGKEFKVPRMLAHECSFLPTHDLIDATYIDKVVKAVNEQSV